MDATRIAYNVWRDQKGSWLVVSDAKLQEEHRKEHTAQQVNAALQVASFTYHCSLLVGGMVLISSGNPK